jgi:RIP metalloprotease RseP
LDRKRLIKIVADLLLVALVAYIFYSILKDKSLAEYGAAILNLLKVIAGLCLLIFFHELGHFLAAKACRVRVETFSIGFGPPIPGCEFRYGETYYKIAQFPLGGYVKMLGQTDPGEKEEDEIAAREDPRSYLNKPVGQRMIIISAGVVMNLLLGMACFIYIYLAGRDVMVPRLGAIVAGSPAERAARYQAERGRRFPVWPPDCPWRQGPCQLGDV